MSQPFNYENMPQNQVPDLPSWETAVEGPETPDTSVGIPAPPTQEGSEG